MKKAAFVDIDGTLTDHGVAHRIGREAFDEAKGFSKLYAGTKAVQVMLGTPIKGEDWGLQTFIESLAKVGTTRDDMERYCKTCLGKNLKYNAIKHMKKIGKEYDLWLLTTGCDIGPQILEREYELGLKGYLANKLIYCDDQLLTCAVRYNEKNISDHVSQIADKYDDFIVIDDRPERYDENWKVYSSIYKYAHRGVFEDSK